MKALWCGVTSAENIHDGESIRPKARERYQLHGFSVDTMMIMEVTVHFHGIDTTLVTFEAMIV